jgi:F-type H+-transporting ATPase subunit a
LSPFEHLAANVQELVDTIQTAPISSWATNFTPYIVLIFILCLLFGLIGARKLTLVPKGRAMGIVEFFYGFTTDNMGYGVMGEAAKKHLPFLLTLFLFLLLSNLVGIIPGLKPATGTMGTTAMLAIISYIYYTVQGVKERGAWHYILSIGPTSIRPIPLAAFIWILELASNLLRLLTLSVRLFANMFAGHILLGVIAVLCSLFLQSAFSAMGAMTFGYGAVGVLWFVLLVVMYALEVFVACIQAYVFTMLSSVYIMLATQEH